jgi:2-dehydro-3-deoxyphosphogluconate aldolase/(4S)-4-hydroxy-2-oxoglutarate aldolase
MKLPEKAVSGIYKNNADVIVRMQRHLLVAVVRSQSSDEAYRIACAASDAGIWFVEITFTVPDALRVIERLALRSDLYVGAGTVLSKKDGKEAIEAGARFVVSPTLELDLIPLCHKAGVACFPGAATPTEILTARRVGADLVKIFPADLVGGPHFIRQMQGPFPDVRFMVSGGVSLANIQEYVHVGVTGICLGSAYLGSLLAEKGNSGFVKEIKEFIKRVEEAQA